MRALAGLVLLTAVATQEDTGTRHFRYQRTVLRPADSTGQTCIRLPPEVFPHARAGLEDLRVFAGEREVPYALRVATPPRAEPVVRLVSNLGTQDGDTTFEADPPAGEYNQVTLELSAWNYIATVTVTGSHGQPGSAPVTLGTFTVFDLSRQHLGHSSVLHLPPSNFEHLRFRIRGRVTPADVGGLRFERDVIATELPFVTVAVSRGMRQDGHRSVLDLTVPPHVPVDRVRVVPATGGPAAFSRDVEVTATPQFAAPPVDGSGVPVVRRHSGTLQRIHRQEEGGRVDVENFTLDTFGLPADAATKWNIAIDNGDDAPLPLDAVELQIRERDLCFEAGPDSGSNVLFYGDARRAAPTYDYQRLFVSAAQPVRATLDRSRVTRGTSQPRMTARLRNAIQRCCGPDCC